MAGIIADSASQTMGAGDTSADNSRGGYLTRERITLSTNPTGSTYAWGLAAPVGSAAARSALTDSAAASPTFYPDVAGYYVVTCTVNGSTFYVLRLSITQAAVSTSVEAVRHQPKTNTAITAPALGQAVFHSSDTSLLSAKRSDGTVRTLEARGYTPTGSADTAGVAGDVAYDASFLYIKTASGWRRVAIASF